MKTIIGTEVKYDRLNNKKRASRRNEAGLTSREQQKQDLIKAIHKLKEQGLVQIEVALKLEKSIRTIKQYWKNL